MAHSCGGEIGSSSQYLADLEEIRKAYVQDVKENYPINIIPETEEKINPSDEISSKKSSKGQLALPLEEVDGHSAAAQREFGTTTDFAQAGFVLQDGRMLKLSQYGRRGVQHKIIERVFDDAKGSDAVNRFIQEGNIRIKAESQGIEIGTEKAPTVSQLNTVSRFISSSLRGKGYLYLDITDKNGNDVASVMYTDRDSTSGVISDIKDYYARGRMPVPYDDMRYAIDVDKVGEVGYNKSKVVRYIPYDKVGQENVRSVRLTLAKIFGATNGIADGIAVSNGDTVYIVDAGKENGKLSVGFRKKLTFTDEKTRLECVRRINDDAISKGFVSDGLSARLGIADDNSRRSGMRREFGEELHADQREPENLKGEVSARNADGGGLRETWQYSLPLEDLDSNDGQGAEAYSYEALTGKPDLTVVELPDSVPMKGGGVDRSAVLSEARKNVREQKHKSNTEKETFVFVPDIGLTVRVAREGIDHGLSRNSEDTALATMKVGALLSSSVAVNELNGRTTRKKATDMSYVLLAVAQNKKSSYLVRIVVDKNTNSLSEISTYGLGAVKAKKEGTLFMPEGNVRVEDDSSVSYLRSTISIADLLENVKSLPLANEVFSLDVLEKLGVARTKGSLSDSVRYSLPLEDLTPAEEQAQEERQRDIPSKRRKTKEEQLAEQKERAEKKIKSIFSTQGSYEILRSVYGLKDLSPKNIHELCNKIWRGMSACVSAEEKAALADDTADYILSKLMSEDRSKKNPEAEAAKEELAYLRRGIGRLTFSEALRENIPAYNEKSVKERATLRRIYRQATANGMTAEDALAFTAFESGAVQYAAEITSKMSETEKATGNAVAKFIEDVNQMVDKAKRTKRKMRIGLLSAQHASTINALMRTIDPEFSADGYELWIDGTSAQHIEARHGEYGEADKTMATKETKSLIPWAAQNADMGSFITDSQGNIRHSDRFSTRTEAKHPKSSWKSLPIKA